MSDKRKLETGDDESSSDTDGSSEGSSKKIAAAKENLTVTFNH